MKPEMKTLLYISTILILSHISVTYSAKQWDYNKGGADWPESCKKGNQAPINIAQPFTYKRILIKINF